MTFQLSGNAADIYEQVLVPLWFRRWAHELLAAVALKSGEQVLDVACGTGVTTRLAKEQVGATGRVDGVDINAEMLRQARELATGLDINWIESDVCNTGLPPNSFNAIICQHGYHYFPDKPAALTEFRNLMKPKGRLAFSIWDGHSPYTAAVCDAVERFISPDVANAQRGQRKTPSAEALHQQTKAAGFSDVRVLRQELEIEVPHPQEFIPLHLGSMPIASAFQALSDGQKQALIDQVTDVLKNHLRAGKLVYSDAVHVVLATK